MATKTKPPKNKLGKIQRQILENIRDRRICGDRWLAVKHRSRRDAVIAAKDVAYERSWSLSGVQLVTAATLKQVLREIKASDIEASRKIDAILDTLPLSSYTTYGLTFYRQDDDDAVTWSLSFDGHHYRVWQPKECAHWIVSCDSSPLNLGIVTSEGHVVEAQSGPLFVRCGIEPSSFFWMVFLSEYLVAPNIYSARKSCADRVHAGEKKLVDCLLTLNPDKLFSVVSK